MGWRIKDVIELGDDRMTVILNIGREYVIERTDGKFVHPYWDVKDTSLENVLNQVIDYDREYELFQYGQEQDIPPGNDDYSWNKSEPEEINPEEEIPF